MPSLGASERTSRSAPAGVEAENVDPGDADRVQRRELAHVRCEREDGVAEASWRVNHTSPTSMRVAEQVDELGRVGRLKRFLAPQWRRMLHFLHHQARGHILMP